MDSIERRARELLEIAANAEHYGIDYHEERLIRESDALEAIRNALMPQWQPIEKAPKDGTEVDLWHPKLGRITGSNWDTYMERWTILCDPEGPTHYMLPPAPPEVP